MIRLAFCDDNPDVISHIETLMSEISFSQKLDWDLFSSGKKLLQHIDAGDAYNIYVLDIEMPETDGIQIAKKIRESNNAAVIIFLTDFKEYVYQVFEVLPFRFLEKPLDFGKLQTALYSAIEHIQTHNMLFFFQVGHEHLQRPIGNIKYFESAGRKVTLFATNEQYVFYGKLDEIIQRLNQSVFTRPHASYIVNQEFIRSIRRDEIVIAEQIIIPISKRYRASFKKDYMLFVERRNGIS